MSILKSKRLWWLALFAMLLLIWAVYSSQSAVASHTPGQLYEVTMDIRATTPITGPIVRNECAESFKGTRKHDEFTKFGRLATDGGNITLDGVTLTQASMSLRVGKDENFGQLQLFFGSGPSPSSDAFSTRDIPVTISSNNDGFEVVPATSQVEVSKDNKKKKGQGKKGQGEPQVVGQITIGTAFFDPDRSGTCDPNDPNP